MEIRSMPATKEYRKNWDKTFKGKSVVWETKFGKEEDIKKMLKGLMKK